MPDVVTFAREMLTAMPGEPWRWDERAGVVRDVRGLVVMAEAQPGLGFYFARFPALVDDLMAEVERLRAQVREDGLWAATMEAERDVVRRERDRLRQALGFYADPESWEWKPDPSGGWSGRLAVADGGAVARAALAQTAREV